MTTPDQKTGAAARRHLVASGRVDLSRVAAHDDRVEALQDFEEGVVP